MLKVTDVSEVHTASIIRVIITLMMQAVFLCASQQ
jgi:hypothetical protein